MHQYYYADQGPTYTGPGDFAPHPVYREGEVSDYGSYRHHAYGYGYQGGAGYGYRTRPWRHTGYGYGYHRGYAPRFYGSRHSMRYGAPMGMPRYGYRERTLRRYY